MVPDFSLYTPEELLDDPAFVGPVLQGRYAQEFPAPTPAIAGAARLILSLRYETDRLDEGEQAELWSQIQSKISPAKVRRIIPLWLCMLPN